MIFSSYTDLIVRAPQSIIGYHGCLRSVAERLVLGEAFRLSRNDYDWLGSGAYFWEYAPYRAQEWAQQLYGEEWAVLRATIYLGNCLNLLDTGHFADLKVVYVEAVTSLKARKLRIPKNSRGAHRLDRLVIDEFAHRYQSNGGFLDTVRGCFPEGTALFEGSQLLSHTHVQVAVRNSACIQGLELVNYG